MERTVRIQAFSRIHIGLLNESGMMGRVDGGLGFALGSPHWDIELAPGDGAVHGQDLGPEFIDAIRELFRDWPDKMGGRYDLHVKASVPRHAGLGAKTALLMAVGRGLAILGDLDLSCFELARLVRRGGTSGIGVNTFTNGGVVWDLGHRFPEEKHDFVPTRYACAPPPATYGHYELDWLRVIHFRFTDVGLHSDGELEAFRRNCPIPESETLEILANQAFRIIPGVVERNEAALQIGLQRIQNLGFKKIEWRYQSSVTRAFQRYWLQSGQPEALGLSSFGPTLYVLTRYPERVLRTISEFNAPTLHLVHTEVPSHGAQIVEVKSVRA